MAFSVEFKHVAIRRPQVSAYDFKNAVERHLHIVAVHKSGKAFVYDRSFRKLRELLFVDAFETFVGGGDNSALLLDFGNVYGQSQQNRFFRREF